jgi:hypothetical protein
MPVGPRREYAPSYFVVLTPGWMRCWKGKSLDDEQLKGLPGVPTPEQLAAFRLRELPAVINDQQESQ